MLIIMRLQLILRDIIATHLAFVLDYLDHFLLVEVLSDMLASTLNDLLRHLLPSQVGTHHNLGLDGPGVGHLINGNITAVK